MPFARILRTHATLVFFIAAALSHTGCGMALNEKKVKTLEKRASKPQESPDLSVGEPSELALLALDELVRSHRSVRQMMNPPKHGEVIGCASFESDSARSRFLTAHYKCRFVANDRAKGLPVNWTLKGRERFYLLGSEASPYWKAESSFDLIAQLPKRESPLFESTIARTLTVTKEPPGRDPETWSYFFQLLTIEGSDNDTSKRHWRAEITEEDGGEWILTKDEDGKTILVLEQGLKITLTYREPNSSATKIILETAEPITFASTKREGKSQSCFRPIGRFNWSVAKGSNRKRGTLKTDLSGIGDGKDKRAWSACLNN